MYGVVSEITVTIDGDFWKGLASVVTAVGVTIGVILTALSNRKADHVGQKVQDAIRKVEVVDTKVSTTNNRNIGTLAEDLETARIKEKQARGEELEAFEASHMRTVEEHEDIINRPAAHAVRPPRPKIPDDPDFKQKETHPQ